MKYFENSKAPMFIMKGENFTQCNAAAASALKISSKAVLEVLHPTELSPEYQPDGMASHILASQYIARCYRDGSIRFPWVHQDRDGKNFAVEVTLVDISTDQEQVLLSKWRFIDSYDGYAQTQQNKSLGGTVDALLDDGSEFEIAHQDEKKKIYKLLNEHKKAIDCSVIVSKTDACGNITYVNDKFCEISGYERKELLGKSHNIVNHPDMPKSVFATMWATIKQGDIWQGVIKNQKKGGGYYYVNTTISPIKNSLNQVSEYIAIRSDITEVFAKDDVIHFLSNDPICEAYNRNKLDSDLLSSEKNCFAIIKVPELMDILTIYKIDTYNEVVKIIADFIRQHFSRAYVLYRVNERSFAILTLDESLQSEMEGRCAKLIEAFEGQLIRSSENDFAMSMNIGISRRSDMESVYSGASIALRTCEHSGEKLVVYSHANPMYQLLKQTNQWAIKIKSALQDEGFAIFGQKLVNTQRQEVSTEVLMRYFDPQTQAFVSPFHFLEHAHRAGVYHQLSLSVITKAAVYFSQNDERFSVNLCFSDIENTVFSQQIIDVIARTGVGPRMTLELVESENYDLNHKALTSFLDAAKRQGCQIAIDDFGSGYSNFEYLTTLPIDLLKIDGSLIQNIADDHKHYLVVKSLISFCRAIDVKIVAEFVKDEAVYELLKDLGVDYFQGFYFHQPALLTR